MGGPAVRTAHADRGRARPADRAVAARRRPGDRLVPYPPGSVNQRGATRARPPRRRAPAGHPPRSGAGGARQRPWHHRERDGERAVLRSARDAGADAPVGRGVVCPGRSPRRDVGDRLYPPVPQPGGCRLTINILIADDHPVVRTGLRQILGSEGDVWIVAEVAEGDALLRTLASAPGDVLLLARTLPGAPCQGRGREENGGCGRSRCRAVARQRYKRHATE